jgi:glutathione S-transferase
MRRAGASPKPTTRNGSNIRPANVGQITIACALGYRDFRFGGNWRSDHPRLVAWLDDFAARVPAFAATKPG